MANFSLIEAELTKPVRRLAAGRLSSKNSFYWKNYAFVVSLVSCVCAGTVILFSLWTPYFTAELGYSQFEINIIAGMTSMGMYLPLPVIGNLADVYGTVLLSVLALVAFVPSYWIAAGASSYLVMTACFAAIGFATSCLYFASLLTCANIYPHAKGLSISLPVTCYGLSSLLTSKLIQSVSWFHWDVGSNAARTGSGNYNVPRIFRFFAVLYLVVALFSYTACSLLTVQKQLEASTAASAAESENQRLLEDSSLLAADSQAESVHKTKFAKFLQDPAAHLFLVAFFFVIGPMEMYINNMGSLIGLVNTHVLQLAPQSVPINVAAQVSYYSLFSTVVRLCVGALSDYLAKVSPTKLVFKKGCSRVSILLLVVFFGVLSQVLIVCVLYNADKTAKVTGLYTVVSCLSGLSYGGVFTIYPSIIASVWGIEILGSTWGSYMIAPAFSSLLFGVGYAKVFDRYGIREVAAFFVATGLSMAFALAVVVATWVRFWRKPKA